MEMRTHLHGPMDYAKTLNLRFRVGDLDLPERRKWHDTSRVEVEEGAQRCPCGNAEESRTHVVGEYELHKDERHELEQEIMKVDECDMDKYGKVDSSKKTTAILRDRGWSQTVKQEGGTPVR